MAHPSNPTDLQRRALLGWAALLCLSACGSPTGPLRVGSIVFSGYEPVFLARTLGLLPPDQVRLIELLSNTDTLRALAARQLEAAQLTLDEFLTARAGGLDLRVVAVLDISQGADAVVARPGLGEPPHFKGRRVAVEDGAVGGVMLSAFLRANGLQPSDVVKVPYTMDRSLEYFRAGRADLFVTASPWLVQMEAAGAARVYDSNAIPDRIVDVMVVRADVFDTHASAIRALVAAHFEAVARFKTHPQTVAPLMAKRLDMAPEGVMAAFEGLQLPDAQGSATLLQPHGPLLRQVKSLMDVMVQDGLLRHTLPLDALFDTRFHPNHR
jgi:NitT/TauT family transport system substrate-binding protein